jgi:hypothetical protein
MCALPSRLDPRHVAPVSDALNHTKELPMQNAKAMIAVSVSALVVAALAVLPSMTAHAGGGLVCRKVVAPTASGEGRNAAQGSRVRCGDDEMLTGGTCYPEVRPEQDNSCQTSAMGIIQTLADHPSTTQGAFFTCMQTGGSTCGVEERTRAMAICCKMGELPEEKKPE